MISIIPPLTFLDAKTRGGDAGRMLELERYNLFRERSLFVRGHQIPLFAILFISLFLSHPLSKVSVFALDGNCCRGY